MAMDIVVSVKAYTHQIVKFGGLYSVKEAHKLPLPAQPVISVAASYLYLFLSFDFNFTYEINLFIGRKKPPFNKVFYCGEYPKPSHGKNSLAFYHQLVYAIKVVDKNPPAKFNLVKLYLL